MVGLRLYAMFYNLLYYLPFVRNKALVKKRVRSADKATMENVRCVLPPPRTIVLLGGQGSGLSQRLTAHRRITPDGGWALA